MSKHVRLWLVMYFLIVGSTHALANDKPNVIVIITDDQGYGDVSAHGNPVLRTPNIDRLHDQSARFTDFHVSPMCSPTRGQLMTGIDAMKNGCTAVCQGRSMMRRELPTMANFFADSGYATGHFGKWHLGDSYPHRPQDRGFHETLHHRAWGITSLADYWGNTYFDPVLSHNGTDRKYAGYCTDIFFDEAKRWMERQSREGKPFFCYLATNTPHGPDVCADVYSDPYVGTLDGKPMPSKFYGMIANLDENVGKLHAFLREEGLHENTIVIYMADNGTQSQQAAEVFNAGMRGKKTSVYEGGHRVPLFVRWPAGGLPPDRDIDALTQVQDLLPTLIDLCGLENGPGAKFDGTSLAGLLKGSASELPDRKLVVQYRVSGEPWDPAVVMWGKWRLLNAAPADNEQPELYHIGRDPGQTRDVADEHAEIVQAMSEHYQQWYGEAKPLFDRERWITIGSEAADPVKLYAQDWVGDYCDNLGGLIEGWAIGYWNVEVANPGVYEIELRRYPTEAEAPLNAGFAPYWTHEKLGQIPVVAANLRVDGQNFTLDAQPGDTRVVFRVHLETGRQRLHTSLMNARGETICSAMYVNVARVLDASRVELTAQSDRYPKPGVRPGPTVVAAPVLLSEDDVLMVDFEKDAWGEWAATGTAFRSGPVEARDRLVGHQGKYVLDTHVGNNHSDQATGTLTSPVFTIDRDFINFRIGGGRTPERTCVNLLIDGSPVRSAVGNVAKNSRGQRILQWVSWDVSEFKGRAASIQIVDAHSGGWGHIVVDQMFRSDRAAVRDRGAPRASLEEYQ